MLFQRASRAGAGVRGRCGGMGLTLASKSGPPAARPCWAPPGGTGWEAGWLAGWHAGLVLLLALACARSRTSQGVIGA